MSSSQVSLSSNAILLQQTGLFTSLGLSVVLFRVVLCCVCATYARDCAGGACLFVYCNVMCCFSPVLDCACC